MHVPSPDSTTHVHRRDDWRPCPATMLAPLTPTKPGSIWLFAWAEAQLHLETLSAFVAEHPAEFPRLATVR